MKIKDGFVMKSIAGTDVVMPIGDNMVSFGSVITLNETGVFLWQKLQEETTQEKLVSEMLKEYNVDEATAKSDVAEFVNKLQEVGVLV